MQNNEIGSDLHLNPRVTHFSGFDFKANEQFYTMIEDQNGILYFGNNDGVLIYDGERWSKVVLPNNSAATSLVISEKGEVYAGGYNELGQVRKDSLGRYIFLSLKDKFKLNDSNFEYLWQAHSFSNQLIFRSFSELLFVSDNGVTFVKPKNFFSYSGVIDGKFYAMDYDVGLMRYDLEKQGLSPVLNSKIEDLNGISAFLSSEEKDRFYVATKSGNIYDIDATNQKASLWKSVFENDRDELSSAIRFRDTYLLGTRSSKLFLLSNKGELVKDHGAFSEIGNATFVNFHVSGENLWILKNNGLSFMEFDLPDFHLFNKASVYDILIDDGTIFLATNSGVYFSDSKLNLDNSFNFKFEKVPNLEGQIWSVKKFNEQILLSGHNGLFYLENGEPKILNGQDSFWKVLPMDKHSDSFLAASYKGLYPLKFVDSKWVLGDKIKGFDESSRDIIAGDEPNTFWICHGYKGVYRLKLEDDLDRAYSIEHFTDKNGLDSPFNINVTRYEDQIIFTTNTGIFTFNEEEHIFKPFEPLNGILSPQYNTTKILKEGEITWFVQNNEFGYFHNTDPKGELHKSLFLNLKGKLNRSMESFIPLGNQRVLIGANDGLYLYQTETENASRKFQTFITSSSYYSAVNKKWVIIPIDSVKQLPRQIDILRFEFGTPGMSVSVKRQYQFKLETIDANWSDWSDNTFKEYTYLEPGTYVFKVRSRNMTGQTGNMASISFIVPHAWYETYSARVGFLVMLILILLGIVFLVQKSVKAKIKKEKDTAQRSKRLLQLEIEQLKLKQQSHQIEQQKNKLEEDLISQHKELSNYTMLLVKKKEVIANMYEELKLISKELKPGNNRKSIQGLIGKIKQHQIGEEYMEVFDVNFERVHVDFFNRLLMINPDLTKRELRLCAFVKMDLSNKEIAPLLNISVRGVETGRYRIRKKLDIHEKNFKNYLDGLGSGAEDDLKKELVD
ncbi:triple tyrosine motif-containing protein [Lutimonas sp.]|uniref:helix-turn-helix and ligand-binding sensor domain-containing protein n=1 Tax=Lutimonas sp. TaxID=1872403 RepID=UPI003C73A8CD